MSAVVAGLLLLVELGLGVALLVGTFFTLAFSSESYRNSATPLHQALNMLAFVLAVLPLVLTLWVGWRRFLSDRPFDAVPLGMGLPMVALVACAVTAYLCFMGGAWATSRHRAQQEQDARLALRAEVEGGAVNKACDLVATDPRASAEDMRRCRAFIESRPDAEARWGEFLKFTDPRSGFNTWHLGQVGLAPDWEWGAVVPVIRHDQEWFLRTFYETWLARTPGLPSLDDLNLLQMALQTSTRYLGWEARAVETLRTQVLPTVSARMDAQEPSLRAQPGMDAWVLDAIRDRMQRIQKTPEDGVEPLPPLPGTPAPGDIGVVRMDGEGNLDLWLRASPTSGAIGDVYVRRASYDSEYERWRKFLGDLRPGELRFFRVP
ncbi:hypothetical protein [Corallococcus aberystwythensis]|uniref:Uncharacterized protein n=1 Tax=Corallococcus aberystwythensis TaxID=2316722 RepID=A0A3A8Q809_9BACT|nr:hypothetical protein [Corallococcus aberystwythensis]RKH64746.1 hypothetical protein D7W81_18060 [Corallococcus aberystwythensis]